MSTILSVAGVVLRCWMRRKEGYILVLILAAVLYAVSAMDVLATTGGTSLYLYDVGLRARLVAVYAAIERRG